MSVSGEQCPRDDSDGSKATGVVGILVGCLTLRTPDGFVLNYTLFPANPSLILIDGREEVVL